MDADFKEEQAGEAPAEDIKQEEAEIKPENVEVTDEEVRARLLALLNDSDLSVVTEKMLRKSLEDQLGVKLGDKKLVIRQEVLAYLEAVKQQGGDAEADEQEAVEAEEEQEEEKPKTNKRRGGGGKQLGSTLSEEMQAFLGVKRMARPQVVKAIWAYIKENNLQDPRNKRKVIVDEKLGTIFKPPITMFNMNKQLSKHVFSKNQMGYVSDDEAAAGSADDGSGGDDEEERPAKKKRPGTGYAAPLPISEELAAASGQSEMSRGCVVKWVYAYATEHNLYDPSNKRYILSDETLKKLTGQKRFLAFGCQKLFSKHFKK